MSTITEALDIYDFKHFSVKTLTIESNALKTNPLNDTHIKRNPVLVPKGDAPQSGYPVVIVLAGYSGNGPKYFAPKTFEQNMAEVIDHQCSVGEAPKALYVFVDAMNFWGGSQFINSSATGQYEDYIIKDLYSEIQEQLPASSKAQHWCVTGGSSGGYGSLHLGSKFPGKFGLVAAIAPDSFFEASLYPELISAIPTIERFGGLEGVKKALRSGELLERRDAHNVLNAVAMCACYCADGKREGHFDYPVDFKTGQKISELWDRVKNHDPIYFLAHREDSLKKLDGIFLEVGNRDQYHLQYGARQINEIFKQKKIHCDYNEFKGNHFDISSRREYVWRWLNEKWS